MTGKELKEKIRQREPVLGSWIQECNWPGLIQLYSAAGLEFVIIDLEHSSIGAESAATMIMLARRAGLSTFIRVPDSLYHLLAKSMDWGASGVVVPQVGTAEQAREVVQCVKYPPMGRRGMSTVTGHRDYFPIEPLADYQVKANEENIVIIQIETELGVRNAESILAVPGLDLVLLGFVDLSVSMGITGQSGHPRIVEAVEHVIQAAAKNKVAVGIGVGTMEDARRWCDRGLNFIAWSNEIRMIAGAITSATEEFQSLTGGAAKA